MMDAYMRLRMGQQVAGTFTMDDIRRAQASLKQNGWHGLHDCPARDAGAAPIDLVCIDGVWQAPLGLTNARR